MRFERRSVELGTAVLLCLMAGLVSCDSDRVVRTACREDAECAAGELCDDYVCIPAAAKRCDVITDGQPLLQPDPHTVVFGDLSTRTAKTALRLHNVGNCALTLFEARLSGGSAGFGSDLLEAGFPLEIFPGRWKDVEVRFEAPDVGDFRDELLILSDDGEFPELAIPLHARFLGEPKLQVSPAQVDFGYVAQGRHADKVVQISNLGTGVAPLLLKSVALADPSTTDFTLVEAFGEPRTLAPLSGDRTALVSLTLRYTPRSTAIHTAELVVVSDLGEVRVPVLGNSETPPSMVVAPETLDLGEVPLGATRLLPVTVSNQGGVPLKVTMHWGGVSVNTDLFATPGVLPAIAPGALTTFQVGFTPSVTGLASGLLTISSNDPARPSKTLAVTARGVPGTSDQVVKVEMVYENGSDSAFDEDVRNVDLVLEHPFGYICNKHNPNPQNWGAFGNPSWMSFPPKDEPERIVLADAQANGTYRVMLQYVESCASLPTSLAAGLLGISSEVLVGYLSGGVVPLNGQDISKMISDICLNNDPSAATVRVYVNGALVKEKTVTLGKKGDTVYAVDLVRSNGGFTAQ